MDRPSVFLLLLWCVCGVDLLNPGLSEQSQAGAESVRPPEQIQPCLSDIHAALRDMSAKLATLQVRLEQEQILNREQNTKLMELQRQVDTQEQAQANEVDTLKKLQQAQRTELNSIVARTNVTEHQVESLSRDRAVGQVAFSASLLESGAETVGPFNAHTLLVFKNVFSNLGNAYSPDTGFFTAPVKGLYHFEIYIAAYGAEHASGAALVKNGQHICFAYENQSNGFAKSSNGVSLLLEPGDAVYVRLWHNTVIYDNELHHSTLSGHLLFPM